ncbi:hypothetical protein MOQ_006666 [Trypanosoma cruzi marinkellei]|uniref:Uncharacterized protein n=1 Tax=Trypanosoma cruzi marinkellei TaxID=85056 RepID=K2MV23_TRYCR|nr:hypothetical protein MOQ_006666 [Trypanosoma cruzi marinkellei]
MFCLPACLAPSVATRTQGACWEDGGATAPPARKASPNHRNARPSTPGMSRHLVDGRARSAVVWAGGRQSAARGSAWSGGDRVGKGSRRRPRRFGLPGAGGTAPPAQGTAFDPQGARGPVGERAGVATRLCAAPRLGSRRPGGGQEQSPRHTEERLSSGLCAFLFLQDSPPARSLHCREEAHVPGIDAALREEPRRDGISVRCQFAWDSAAPWGKYGNNCATSLPQEERHDANLLGDFVVHRQRVRAARLDRREGVCGDRNSCGRLGCCRRGTGRCPWPCSVAGHSARQERASFPAAARRGATGSPAAREQSDGAADSDARSARDDAPSIQRPRHGPIEAQEASRADRLTSSAAKLGAPWREDARPLQHTVSQTTIRRSAWGGADVVLREQPVWLRTRRGSSLSPSRLSAEAWLPSGSRHARPQYIGGVWGICVV